MTDFNGKRVLLTGAAHGIGRLMALKMAGKGARMVLWDLDEEGLDRLKKDIERIGSKAFTGVVDVTDREAIKAAAESVLEEVGPIDILVNNAGVVSGKTIMEADDEDINRTFGVNTLALFWVTRAFLPEMVRRNSGHIVTIASAAGLVGTSRLTDYSASKFAAVGFDESLRLEMKRLNYRIKTTVVCPFYISTGMFEGVKTRFSMLLPILDPEECAEKIVEAIEQGKQRLVMPRFVLSTFPLRMVPTRIFDGVLGLLGVNKSMDEFTGRADASEKDLPKKKVGRKTA